MRLVAMWITVLGCAGAPPPAPTAPPPPHLAAPPPCEGHAIEMRIEGEVRAPDGMPVGETPLVVWDDTTASWTPRATTGPDGTYSLVVPGPSWIGVDGWRSAPGAQCAAIPARFDYGLPEGAQARMVVGGFHFVAPQTCRYDVTVPDLDRSSVLLAWRPEGVVVRPILVHQEVTPVFLPCDVRGLAMVTPQVASLPDPGCDLPAPFTCVAPGGGAVTLQPGPVQAINVQVVAADGTPLPDAFVHDGLRQVQADATGGVAWRGWPGRPVLAQAPGHLAATMPPDTEMVWTASLTGGRDVRLVVDPAEASALPATCQAPGAPPAPVTCHDQVTEVVCTCPEGPADLDVDGLRLPVPADATEVVLPMGQRAGGVTFRMDPGTACRAVLTPARPAWSWWRAPAPASRGATCAPDGTVVLPFVAPGDYALSVHVHGAHRAVDVTVDDTVVDLGTLDVGEPR